MLGIVFIDKTFVYVTVTAFNLILKALIGAKRMMRKRRLQRRVCGFFLKILITNDCMSCTAEQSDFFSW